MDILVLDKICKSYGDGEGLRTVLKDVSLTVAEGEFIAVTGPSGSGKTTLLKIMGSLLAPDSGKCFIDGEDISACPDLPGLRNRRIGFVFQDHRLLPQLSVLQNVLLPALAGDREAPQDTVQYARRLLEYAGISELEERYPENISGGEASRVALCRALVMKPQLILADEPTGQLDHDNAINIAQLLKTVSRDFNTAVVMVTHSDEVAALADRQISLYKLNENTAHN